jgi:hypothetical protein
VTGVRTADGLPTDDDRPERRRRRSLIVAGVGIALLIAGLLVVFAKPNPKLHPTAAPSAPTTAPAGNYATEVSAADSTLAGLLALVGTWDTTSAGLQKDLVTANSGAGAALAALQTARAAHRAKPQNCAVVVTSSSQAQTSTAAVITTADSVSARATQVLDALSQSQSQIDQLTAHIAEAGAQATPAQLTALQSLQVSASSLGARRAAFTQSMTTFRAKADAAAANAQTLAGQAATLTAGCPH